MDLTQIGLIFTIAGVGFALINLLLFLVFEHLRRPKLSVVRGDESDGIRHVTEFDKAGNPIGPKPVKGRFIHLKVLNAPIDRNLRGLLRRQTAELATVKLSFARADEPGTRFTFPARWNALIEPLHPWEGLPINAGIPDSRYMNSPQETNIVSGGERGIPVALKLEGEEKAHGFNAQSYAFPNWQNPAWALLPDSEYRVTAHLRVGDIEVIQSFVLVNRGISANDLYWKVESEA